MDPVLPHWNARARDVGVYSNGDIAVVGSVSNGISFDAFAARLDPNGNEIWFTQNGDTFASEYINHLAFGSNQTLYIGGYRDIENDFNPVIVVPFNDNGELGLENSFRVPNNSVELYDFDCLDSGELLMLIQPNGAPEHPLLVKVGVNGDTVWTRELVELWIRLFRMEQLHKSEDGGCIMTGGGFAPGPGTPENLLIARCDSVGNVIFARDYGGLEEREYGRDIALLPDGGYFVVGQTQNCESTWCGWALRVDASGDTLWTHTFDDFAIERCNRCILLADSGFIIGGDGRSGDMSFLSLTRLNYAGDVLWREQYPAGEWDLLGNTGLAPHSSGSYIMVCSRNLGEAYVVMTEPDPLLSVGYSRTAPAVTTQMFLTTYPNPFNSTLSISLDVPLHQEVTVSLYDLLGREVDVVYRGRLSSNTISYVAPAALSSGVYFLRAVSGERSVLGKVVLLK